MNRAVNVIFNDNITVGIGLLNIISDLVRVTSLA